jgi:hypothetical protein
MIILSYIFYFYAFSCFLKLSGVNNSELSTCDVKQTFGDFDSCEERL